MASKRVTPCARCAAKSCTCGLPRRRPTDTERLTWLLKGEFSPLPPEFKRADIDRLMREEARRAR